MKRKKKFIPFEGYNIFGPEESKTEGKEVEKRSLKKKNPTYKMVSPTSKQVYD